MDFVGTRESPQYYKVDTLLPMPSTPPVYIILSL